MIGGVTCRYAFRDLCRHRIRTAIMVGGIAVACAVAEFAGSYRRGALDMQVRAVAGSGTGHLVVVPEAWPETREVSLRVRDPRRVEVLARGLPGVAAAMPRARTGAVLAFGNRSAVVQLTGVSPADEFRGNRMVWKSRIEGRYLQAAETGAVVLGASLAERLDARLDDDLVVSTAGVAGITGAMVHVVGILATGGGEVDAQFAHVTLEQLEELTGLPGPAEVSLLLDDHRAAAAARQRLAAGLPAGNVVVTWKEIMPEMAAGADSDAAFSRLVIGVIMLVVAMGITAAQVTSILERRRELAVLCALGMRAPRVVIVVVMQGLILGVAGGLASLPLGLPSAWYLATRGIPLTAFLGDDLSVGSILLDPVLYGEFSLRLVVEGMALAATAATLAAIYPAWIATRVDPAEAMRRR
ncbi:MAG: ABC transporter permease [Lentisphaeria bacterium]|nr:ABC transporter permease [Lentisphaeria bacterium]